MSAVHKTLLAALALAAVAAVGAGIARSTSTEPIPDANGVIHACYKKPIGPARIVFSAADCGRGESPIEWNQAGRPGPKGDPGPAGPSGPAGTGGVELSEAGSEEGAVVTDASGLSLLSLPLGGPGRYWVTLAGRMAEVDNDPGDPFAPAFTRTRGSCDLLLGATATLPETLLETTGRVEFYDDEIVTTEIKPFTLADVVDVAEDGRALDVHCARESGMHVLVNDLQLVAVRVG
jgi:hypothetical protein